MRKTVVVLTSMFAILLGACGQIPGFGLSTATPVTGPTINTAGTSVFETAVVQTLTAQPTLPVVSATDTPTLPIEPSATDSSVATFTPFATFTVVSNLTTTPATATATTGSPVATSGTGNATASATATLAAGQLTASPTNGILKYGTQPPAVPFSHITLINKAKAEAYISLQVNMPDGKFSILEYPVSGPVKIEAPVGSYLYVAWVGGRKMIGTFKLAGDDDLVITLYKKRIVVR